MYAVELDQSKHLLVISVAQRVTAEQVHQAVQQVRKYCKTLRRGSEFWRIFGG
jgi:hypothetical protein